MSKLRNKALSKLLGPFFKEKWFKTTRKQLFYDVLSYFEAIWATPNVPKSYSRSHLEFPKLEEAISPAAIVMKIQKVMRKIWDP